MARILVVDDSPTVYHYVQRELRRDGHVVDRLRAFNELPLYLQNVEPDVVLLDLEMPALSGVAFGKFIRRLEQQAICILVHSSRPDEEMIDAVKEIGAQGFVPKSATSEELRGAVRRVLQRQAS